MRATVTEYIKALRAVPGTTMAAAGFGAPFTGPAVNQRSVHIEGDAPDPDDRPSLASWKSVTPGYLETLGAKLVRGRYFTDQDREGATKVVIVNDGIREGLSRRARSDRPHRHELGRDSWRDRRHEKPVAYRGA